MSNQGNDSTEQFRYRKSIENMIGKRTGNFIRKSNIGIDFDGLENVNDYFETNTDKLSVANTDDFDTSVASDVFIDASDTEGRSPGGSSVKKGEKSKERRKRRLTEVSSQNSFGFFDEMLQSLANQQDEKTNQKETLATIPDLSSAKPPNPKRKINNALPIAFRTQEEVQSSKDVSPVRDTMDPYEQNEMTNMTAMTHLTKTPSVSRSSIDGGSASKSASAMKNLSIMKQQKENFSEYLQNDQRNKELELKRKQLRQMQESNSQEISIFKSPMSNDYMSPNKAFNLNLTTFSMLESTNRKAGFGANHNASIEVATYNDHAQTYQSFVDHNNESRVERKINLFEEDNRAQLKKPPSSKSNDFQEPAQKKDKGKEKEKEKKDRIEQKENIKEDSNSNPNKKVVKGTKKTVAIIEEEEEVVTKGKNNKTENNKFVEPKNSKTTVVVEEKKTSFEIKPLTKNKNDDKKATINKYTTNKEEEEKENMAPPAPKAVVQKNKKNDKENDKENKKDTKSTTRMIEEEKKQPQRKEAETKLRDITNSQDREHGMTSPGGFDNRFTDSIDVGDHYFDMDQDVGPEIHNDYDYRSYENHYGTSHHYDNERGDKKNKHEEEKNKKVGQITKKEKEKEKDVAEPKLKKIKKTKDVEDHAQEKTKKIKMPSKASKEKLPKKEKDPMKEKKEPVRRNKRKRDAFLENYDRIIGPNDLHLIEQSVPVMRGSFANGRYPKRHRMPTFCFWKNERPIYKDMGNGREMVGLLVEENHPMPLNAFDYASSMEILTQEPKPSKKLAKMNKRASFTDEKQMKKIRNTYVDSEEEEDEEEENNHHHKLQALDKMELDYKVVSEDKDSIKVFLKLKPRQSKESQINIAGNMRCSVIKCEDRKVEVTVDSKQFILSLNDKFTIQPKAVYSIQNKSKNKELELTCNIAKH